MAVFIARLSMHILTPCFLLTGTQGVGPFAFSIMSNSSKRSSSFSTSSLI